MYKERLVEDDIMVRNHLEEKVKSKDTKEKIYYNVLKKLCYVVLELYNENLKLEKKLKKCHVQDAKVKI